MNSIRLKRERRDRYKFHYFSNNRSCVVNLELVSMIGLVLFTLHINETYCNAFSINCNNFNSKIINDRDNHRQIFMIEIGHEIYEEKILIRFLFVTFHHHFVWFDIRFNILEFDYLEFWIQFLINEDPAL